MVRGETIDFIIKEAFALIEKNCSSMMKSNFIDLPHIPLKLLLIPIVEALLKDERFKLLIIPFWVKNLKMSLIACNNHLITFVKKIFGKEV